MITGRVEEWWKPVCIEHNCNGLENTEYGWYGDKLIKALNEKYNLGYNMDEIFDEGFYEEW